MDKSLESSWHSVYFQVSGEPGIARCSRRSDIYLGECGLACKLIHWSSPPRNFSFRVFNFRSWSRPWNYFNSKIFPIYGIYNLSEIFSLQVFMHEILFCLACPPPDSSLPSPSLLPFASFSSSAYISSPVHFLSLPLSPLPPLSSPLSLVISFTPSLLLSLPFPYRVQPWALWAYSRYLPWPRPELGGVEPWRLCGSGRVQRHHYPCTQSRKFPFLSGGVNPWC